MRNPVTLAIQFLIPIIFLIMTMASEAQFAGNKNLPELPIDMGKYWRSVTVLQYEEFGEGNLENSIVMGYEGLGIFKMDDYKLISTKDDIQDFILQKVRWKFFVETLNFHMKFQFNYSLSTTNTDYVVGASITRENITAWFNNQGFHTMPLSLNTLNNAILRWIFLLSID